MQVHIQSPMETTSTRPVTNASIRSTVEIPAGLVLSVLTLLIALQFPSLGWLIVVAIGLAQRVSGLLAKRVSSDRLRGLSGWKILGILAGTLLFASIICQAEPASAQLFNTAEDQANTIFGDYLQDGIIAFLFGLLRIVIWVSAVGFIFFAVYQAQRGEQWQPLIQNAFIVVAAVVVVEGISRLFFGQQ